MNESPVQRALASSAVALVVAVCCLVLFLPPLVERTVASIATTVLVGCALAVALVLHLAFIGIATRRMGRSVPGWVGLGLLFPIGGAAALMLLAFFCDEASLDAAPT